MLWHIHRLGSLSKEHSGPQSVAMNSLSRGQFCTGKRATPGPGLAQVTHRVLSLPPKSAPFWREGRVLRGRGAMFRVLVFLLTIAPLRHKGVTAPVPHVLTGRAPGQDCASVENARHLTDTTKSLEVTHNLLLLTHHWFRDVLWWYCVLCHIMVYFSVKAAFKTKTKQSTELGICTDRNRRQKPQTPETGSSVSSKVMSLLWQMTQLTWPVELSSSHTDKDEPTNHTQTMCERKREIESKTERKRQRERDRERELLLLPVQYYCTNVHVVVPDSGLEGASGPRAGPIVALAFRVRSLSSRLGG